jgi:hypothetical protein
VATSSRKKTLKTPKSLSNASFSDACLLLPALGVHAEHDEQNIRESPARPEATAMAGRESGGNLSGGNPTFSRGGL